MAPQLACNAAGCCRRCCCCCCCCRECCPSRSPCGCGATAAAPARCVLHRGASSSRKVWAQSPSVSRSRLCRNQSRPCRGQGTAGRTWPPLSNTALAGRHCQVTEQPNNTLAVSLPALHSPPECRRPHLACRRRLAAAAELAVLLPPTLGAYAATALPAAPAASAGPPDRAAAREGRWGGRGRRRVVRAGLLPINAHGMRESAPDRQETIAGCAELSDLCTPAKPALQGLHS